MMKKRVGETKISEYLKPTASRIITTLLVSLAFCLLFVFAVPLTKQIFLAEPLPRQIIDLSVNAVILGLLIYPWVCLIILWLRRK